MKNVIVVLIMLAIAGCVSTPKPSPPQDVYFMIQNGMMVTIPQGFFDNPDNYMTEDEYKKAMEEYHEKLKQQYNQYIEKNNKKKMKL